MRRPRLLCGMIDFMFFVFFILSLLVVCSLDLLVCWFGGFCSLLHQRSAYIRPSIIRVYINLELVIHLIYSMATVLLICFHVSSLDTDHSQLFMKKDALKDYSLNR